MSTTRILKLVSIAKAEAARLKKSGWTKADFAKALSHELDAHQYPALVITIFQDKTGRWNYCPLSVRQWPVFAYGDGENGFTSKEEAIEAVKADRTIPPGAHVVVE